VTEMPLPSAFAAPISYMNYLTPSYLIRGGSAPWTDALSFPCNGTTAPDP